jgi:hypothetical protein
MVKQTIVLILVFSSMAACAFDIAHVKTRPTQFTRTSEGQKSFTIKSPVLISDTPCWFERSLEKSSRWYLIGSIPEGDVYKSSNQVLTVECSNIHEAYLVLNGNFLVGFYLPVENAFVHLGKKIELPMQ